jgi:arsenate reductase (thioredoxin)
MMSDIARSPCYNVLFLCTYNSARSIMAEALLATVGKGRFNAYSAGSHPLGVVQPLALELIKTTGYPLDKLRSKSWEEFARPDAPRMDFAFTICDNAASEMCPVWPGLPIHHALRIRGPGRNPGFGGGVFNLVFRQIERRIRQFISLPLESMERPAIAHKLCELGDEMQT